jgi:N-acetylglutamate synthase-like GNAT family acetyltransferase
MFKLIETNDFEGLAEMFYRNGLEVLPDEKAPAGLIKCWEAVENESGKRVGGIVLEKRADEFVIGDITVEENYRRHHLGRMMMERVIQEVKLLGGKRIMLVAKVPDFFRTVGFLSIDRKNAPNISKCMTCKQYNIDCFPEVMYLEV